MLNDLRARYWRWRSAAPKRRAYWRHRMTHRGRQRRCPVCGWVGSAFFPFDGEDDNRCPVCESQPRHRLLKLRLDELGVPSKGARVLHVSPKGEAGLAKWFRGRAGDYLSIDKFGFWNDRVASEAMVDMDLTELRLADESMDFVCCSHVLEHIEEDRKAIGEIFRVLVPGGRAALQVQVYGEKTRRIDNPSAADYYHVWNPGTDYFDRFREAGFEVELIPGNRYDPRLYGLYADSVLPICTKPGPATVAAGGA